MESMGVASRHTIRSMADANQQGKEYVLADIKHSVDNAIQQLYTHDFCLLQYDVNERTITHKLAQYLEIEFPGWDVDCEYNRNHDITKTLSTLPDSCNQCVSSKERSVFPDIIVHKRQTGENLLVIEVKKSTNSEASEYDETKLHGFVREHKYKYALFLILKTRTESKKGDEEITWIWPSEDCR